MFNRFHWYVENQIPQNRDAFSWITDTTRNFMSKGYLEKGELPESRSFDIVQAYYDRMIKMKYPEDTARHNASTLLAGLEQGHVSFATPIWVSYGNTKGLSVSCFGSDLGHESMEDIMYTVSEIAMLTKFGGGTSVNLSKVRPRGTPISVGGTADGAAHFADLFNSAMKIARQGEARRGYCAAYLDAYHDDIEEFLELGTDSSSIQNITTGASITDKFFEQAFKGSDREQNVLTKIAKTRTDIGYPYVFMKDNANRQKPQVYKDLDLEIEMSNLCSEIMLPNGVDETFVCVLSSLNLVYYDEWKDTDLVQVMISFLDTVVDESIEKIETLMSRRGNEYKELINELYKNQDLKPSDNVEDMFLSRVKRFLERHSSLGLGTMGLHHLYQSKMLPFESAEAAKLNNVIFNNIRQKADQSTEDLADMLGEPEILKGYGKRNTTLLAIAPTKSSASIMGMVSESIQPELSNYYLADLAKDTIVVKNPYLEALLEELGENTSETWDKILETDSVSGLDFLTDHQKAVFKTFGEISPRAIIDQGSVRQTYIDQGQSLNLIFHPEAPAHEIMKWMFYAWKMGIKALYYQKGISPAQLNNLKMQSSSECLACSA